MFLFIQLQTHFVGREFVQKQEQNENLVNLLQNFVIHIF